MPKFEAGFHLCVEGWRLYSLFCNHADADDRSRETRQAWKDYTQHRRECPYCTKPKEEDVNSKS